MKKMLINAARSEEVRVALLEGQRLHDLHIESEHQQKKKSNIYKGKVIRIENSLEAAFIEYDSGRHGFLPFREVTPDNRSTGNSTGNAPLTQGEEILVQVEKEERGNKGAGLSNYLSLAGRYLVLMPNKTSGGGVSRRASGSDKQDAREILNSLPVPSGMSVILRTASVGEDRESMQRDLDYLLELWEEIKDASFQPAPKLIYKDSNVVVRILRDYLGKDVDEILVDDQAFYDQAQSLLQRLMPETVEKLHLYTENDPLFSRYNIESQIEEVYDRTVTLPSGGQMIFDSTEALITVDINSARATGGADIEETALSTNLEAARELARQLRLRDIGGLIVIDFIDMTPISNQRKVEDCMRNETQSDRARLQIGRISRFGLLEMSRQRLRPSITEAHQFPCPRCDGTGHLRTQESQVHLIMRSMEEEAMKVQTVRVLVLMPLQIASVIINEQRDWINEIEKQSGARLLLFPSASMQTPEFRIRRISRTERNSTAEILDKETDADPAEAAFNEYKGDKRSSVAAKPVLSYSNRKPVARPKPGLFGNLIRIVKNWFSTSEKRPANRAPSSRGGNQQRRRSYQQSNNGQPARPKNNEGRRRRSRRRRSSGSGSSSSGSGSGSSGSGQPSFDKSPRNPQSSDSAARADKAADPKPPESRKSES